MEINRNKLIECDPFKFDIEVQVYECIRGYKCEECKKTYASIQKKGKKSISGNCKCGGRLISLILGCSEVFVKNITTVGQLADANTKKMGRYELEDKRKELKDRKELGKNVIKKLPNGATRIKTENNSEEYKKLKKISKMTPKQKIDYIHGK